MSLSTFQNIDVSLVLVDVFHHAVAVKCECWLVRVAPAGEVAKSGESLCRARPSVCPVVTHQECRCKNGRSRLPGVRRVRTCYFREPVLVEHPCRRNKL